MLGINVDQGLTYSKHCEIWRQRVFARIRILSQICTRSWGSSFRSARQLAEQFILSSALNGSAGFYGGITAKKNSRELDTAYNSIMRLVSRCLRVTDFEKLPPIVGWDSLEDWVQRRAAHLAHMVLRQKQITPARSLFSQDVVNKRKRKKLRGWRDLSIRFLPPSLYPYIDQVPRRLEPWLFPRVVFRASSCKKNDTYIEKRMAALETLASVCQDSKDGYRMVWEIWSDGSVESTTGHGGSGGAIWSSDRIEPFWSLSAPAGSIVPSYNAEISALVCCMDAFLEIVIPKYISAKDAVYIVCDSLSVFCFCNLILIICILI
ncbi:hypothetical protein FOL47_008389 [Perkinsus chesapeaki]|uniref:Uncharacterized protein n=1 Tax=Perkinsus chesapeaki TaxID=330153 RepID=A0A7J6LEW4_PERCH|nr:hypothetical protein FOL47_008389 [Perkinsus chesapeaki]